VEQISGDNGKQGNKSEPGLKQPSCGASGFVILGKIASGWSVHDIAVRCASVTIGSRR
jgi:hypothetical protein